LKLWHDPLSIHLISARRTYMYMYFTHSHTLHIVHVVGRNHRKHLNDIIFVSDVTLCQHGQYPGNVPSPSKTVDYIFYKYNKFYWIKLKITILSMYQTQISIHSVISISFTQKNLRHKVGEGTLPGYCLNMIY